MLTKSEVLKLLVAYARMRDEALVKDDKAMSRDICSPSDLVDIRRIMDLVVALRDSFRYVESPEFLESIEGKSESVRQMKRKLAADPVRHRETQGRFDRSLSDLLSSDEAFRLAPTAAHGALREISALARRLSNPD